MSLVQCLGPGILDVGTYDEERIDGKQMNLLSKTELSKMLVIHNENINFYNGTTLEKFLVE